MDPSGALCQVSVLGWGGWRGRERSGSSVLALPMDGRHHMWPFLSGESYLHGGQVGDAVHC